MGLKAEPTCRMAWVARLNLLRSKSYPPTMALTAPVFTSMARKAPSTLGSCSSSSLASLRPAGSVSDWTRNGATVPRGSTSARFVWRVHAMSWGPSRAR